MINSTVLTLPSSAHLLSREHALPRRIQGGNDSPVALSADSASVLGKLSRGPQPFGAAPQFWSKTQPPQRMSAASLSQAIAALEHATQRLAHGGEIPQEPRDVRHLSAQTVAISTNASTRPQVPAVFMTDTKADFAATFAPNELHTLLVLLLQVQNTLARTQADVLQMALRQIMAATHARANSIRLDAAVAFGVAIGAAVLSIGLNVAGTRKSLQGLAKRDKINTKFAGAEKTWQSAQLQAIKQPGDTPHNTASKATAKANAQSVYRTASAERDLEFTKVDRMQLKGNAMIQGARIASELMSSFGALSSGLQRVSQTYAETNKTMAELWRAQGQTEMDQRRQATAELLNLIKSMHALEQRGWSDVRIA